MILDPRPAPGLDMDKAVATFSRIGIALAYIGIT
jgi:hypothetical protein